MSKQLRIWIFALLSTLLATSSLLAEGVITMTTTKAVGEKITLGIWGRNVTIEGVKEPFACHDAPYTLTGQTVIIRGNVTKFNAWNSELTNLDASGCTTLIELKCFGNKPSFGNKLTSLNVSGCTALTELYCNDNQLTSLDVSSCTALKKLDCYRNKLTSLDVSACTALTSLKCFGNKLTSLNVSGCTALTELKCYDNQLTSLDVSSCTALKKLDCYRNKLTSLNVSGCTALTELYCYDNQLTALDVSQNTALKELYCYRIKLTSLDVSSCTALTELKCNENQLTALDVSQNTALKELECYKNKLTSLDVSSCTALKKLKCYKNPLTALDVSQNTALTELDCNKNQLTALDLSQNTVLTTLICHQNQLTALDLSQNTVLTKLFCSYNPLTTLDVSENTVLTWLACVENKLAALDVSQNTALTWLDCDNNQLTMLDLSKNTALINLDCYNNQLTALNVSQNTALIWLECYNNQLTALDVSKNTKLETLNCHGNQIKGEEMTRLVNSLPDRTGKKAGEFAVVQEPAPEGNICLKSDVAIAKGKNWNTLKYKSDTRKYVPYEGAQTLKVTLTKEGEGTLTATGAADLNAVLEGTELTIVATPADGYKLTALTANGKDILATKKLSVREDTEIKATFAEKKNYTVTFTPEGEGTLTATRNGEPFTSGSLAYEGEKIVITAQPAEGYQIDKWLIGKEEIESTPYTGKTTFECTVGTADVLIKATFTKKTFAVTLTKEGEGTITATGAADLTAVPYGTELTIEAPPAAGYKLTALTANGTDILATKKLSVREDTEIKATFAEKTFAVKLTKEGEGTLTATSADDLNAVPYGTELTIVATPAEGYELTTLTANGTDILATKKVVVKGATEIKATFTKKTFAVTLTKDGEGTITATGADDLNAVTYGTELTIVATPADGYKLTALTANGTDILATKKVVIKGATEVKATFADNTGVETTVTQQVKLYPNPATDYVIVEGVAPASEVTLHSMAGERLYAGRADDRGTLQIDLTPYADGVYLVCVAGETYRVVVRH